MMCPNCQTENTATARFCIQCGQALPRICPTCGAENPPVARFCNQCGTALPGAAPTSGPLRPAANGVTRGNGAAPAASSLSSSSPVALQPTRAQAAVATLPKGTQGVQAPPEETTEQRRVVTVLFADLTSSTALADAMDPEDVRALLAAFFTAMAREIHKHGGTVEKYIGDAVMAVFGLPVAHEDDPLRAVRAAVDMQAALARLNADRLASDPAAPELRLRIGINTGEVAAAGRPQEGRDFLVTGDPVNLAARLYENAAPGAIWVGPRTYRSTSGAVRYRKLAAVSVRGKPRPVPVWEAIALADESPVPAQRPRGVKGLSAPMVGRDVEMELLHAVFQRVTREQRPHLVTILGAPGVGKTRLARECVQSLLAAAVTPATAPPEPAGDAGSHNSHAREAGAREAGAREAGAREAGAREEAAADVTAAERRPIILEGRCPTYGEGITYWPLAEMLRAYCRFSALEPAESARAKLLGCVRDALSAAGRSDKPEVLAALLGHTIGIETAERRKRLLPGDGTQLQEAMLRAWRVFFEAVAAPAGLVVWVEDIHWADDLLLDLLEYVAARAGGVPLLVLCTARPELLERRTDWGGGKRNYALIQLDALSEPDTRALLEILLPGDGIPEALRQGVLEKADGNPFYVEEILRMLVDRGVLVSDPADGWHVPPDCATSAELADPLIPDTVQGVLLERLDLLPADERDVLQHAAVLGRYFWASALRRLAAHLEGGALDEVLASLQGKELIRVSEHAKNSVALVDEPIYRFNHPLVREVTYATIARARRAREHARVAEMLEALAEGRETELAELLALHYQQYYLQGGLARSRNAARRQAVRDKVLRYLTLAGDQAAARQAAAKAERFYTDAVELLEADGEPSASDVPARVELYAKRGDSRWLAVRADDAWRDYRHALDLWLAYSAAVAGGTDAPRSDALRSDTARGIGRETGVGVGAAAAAAVDAVNAEAVGGMSAVAAMMPEDWRAQGLRLCRLLVQLPTRERGLFQQPPAHEALLPYLEQGLRLAQELGQGETAEYAALLTARAFFWWSWPERRGERELLEALRSAREAVCLMEEREDPRGASEALDALGNIQAATTDLRGYLESQGQRLRWAERIDVARELVDIHSELSLAHQLVGEYAPAAQRAATALEIAREADSNMLQAQALRSAVLAHVEWDNWAEALRLGAELLGAAARAEVGHSDRYAWALLALATVAQRTGRRDETERFVECVAAYPQTSAVESPQYVELFRARLALARGATREARRILLAALERRSGRQSLAAVLAELAELGARVGNAQLYERFGAQALELGWRSGARKALAQATRARAIVALGKRRWDDALSDGETALLSFRALGTQWEAARTRYVLAGVYLRRGAPGDAELAQGELSRAMEAFERLQAVRDMARARSALASGEVRLP